MERSVIYGKGMQIKALFGPMVRLANLLVAIQNAIVQTVVLCAFNRVKLPISRMGTFYGGWWMSHFVMANAPSWQLVSCGLGHDISFDQEMASIGMKIIGIESEEGFIRSLVENGQVPLAMKLIHARVDLKESGGLEIQDLLDLCESENKHSKIAIKLDIEGSEYGVLQKLSRNDKVPEILMFECDYLSLVPFLAFSTRVRRTREVMRVLRNLAEFGYLLYKKENWNFHFIKSDSLR